MKGKGIMAKRRKRAGMRGRFYKRITPEEEVEQREAAFAAIRRLYSEVLPLWRSCARGYCRRHRCCVGDVRKCLARGWPLTSGAMQLQNWHAVIAGGPQRRPPATAIEQGLRRYPPSNFVH
jgi:hypothetical protein